MLEPKVGQFPDPELLKNKNHFYLLLFFLAESSEMIEIYIYAKVKDKTEIGFLSVIIAKTYISF